MSACNFIRLANSAAALTFAALVSGAAVAEETSEAVTRVELQALVERLNRLEAENRAQAERIRELEARAISSAPATIVVNAATDAASVSPAAADCSAAPVSAADAEKNARLLTPLTAGGLKFTPYGTLAFEAIHSTRGTVQDIYSDWVLPPSSQGYRSHNSCFSVQDSTFGVDFETPESYHGWRFTGKAEFDLSGGANANDYQIMWRHAYLTAEHESGWSILIGQTWHLWKMFVPNNTEGAWLEQCGHPYRRSPQLRVTKVWNFEDESSLEVRFGILKNGRGMRRDRDRDGVEDNTASAWPLFEAAAFYKRPAFWTAGDENGHHAQWGFGVSGMYGRERCYRYSEALDSFGAADEYNLGMIMISGTLPVTDRMKLTGLFFAGENLAEIQAGIGQSVGFRSLAEKGKEVPTLGGFLDFSWAFLDDWEFICGYGFDSPTIDDDYTNGLDYGGITHNDRCYFDLAYRINANLRLTIEYARLTTAYRTEGTVHSDRFQFAAFYDF